MALGLLIVTAITIPFMIDRSYLFWGGAVLVLVSFAMSALHLTENKKLKVLSKLILGSSFACVSWAILLADGLTSNLELKFALIITLYLVVVAVLGYRRAVEIEKECKACEYGSAHVASNMRTSSRVRQRLFALSLCRLDSLELD
jgi:hypothetical protein